MFGDEVVSTRAWPTSAQASAIGVWRAPNSARSAQTSSETTNTSSSLHIAATARSSSRDHTRPEGLCGEHQTSARGRSAASAARSAARSSSSGPPRPGRERASTATSRRPSAVTALCSGAYSGRTSATPSPGSVNARIALTVAETRFGANTKCSGSTESQPCSSRIHAAAAAHSSGGWSV